MTEKYSVLIVEDEKDIADAIAEGLKRSNKYTFKTEIALISGNLDKFEIGNLSRCAQKNYDIYVVDLRLKSTEIEGKDYSGFKIIHGINPFIIQKRFDLQGMIIVYSAYSDVENVVRAMKLGATDFISKSDCRPHELVKRIERNLDEIKEKIALNKKIDETLEKKGNLLQKKYPEESIILVGDKVVAHGKTRLEVLIQYHELRKKSPEYPEEPVIIYIAKKEEQ